MKPIHSLMLAAAIVAGAAVPAAAQYPEDAVTIVVPYPPGGTTDILARLVADELSERLKQPFVVENKPGASGGIGSAEVAAADPDGYTLLMGTINSHGINASVFDTLPYDPVEDFAPITVVASTPNVLTVNTSVEAKTLKELLAMARKQPGELNFGSTSVGGSPHMSGVLLKMMADVDIMHIPYKGGGPMLAALIGGQIEMAFDNLPSSMGHIESGTIRPIAVTTPERWPGAPDIPTMAEAGLPDYEVSAWFGLFAPAETPEAIVDLLHTTVSEILAEEEIKARLLELGAQPGGNTPEEFAQMIDAEIARWKEVVETTGVTVQ